MVFHLTKIFICFVAGDETMEDESMAQSQSVNVQRVTADGIYKFTYSKFYFTEKIIMNDLFTFFPGTYATQSAFDTGKSGTSGSNSKDEKVRETFCILVCNFDFCLLIFNV